MLFTATRLVFKGQLSIVIIMTLRMIAVWRRVLVITSGKLLVSGALAASLVAAARRRLETLMELFLLLLILLRRSCIDHTGQK